MQAAAQLVVPRGFIGNRTVTGGLGNLHRHQRALAVGKDKQIIRGLIAYGQARQQLISVVFLGVATEVVTKVHVDIFIAQARCHRQAVIEERHGITDVKCHGPGVQVPIARHGTVTGGKFQAINVELHILADKPRTQGDVVAAVANSKPRLRAQYREQSW